MGILKDAILNACRSGMGRRKAQSVENGCTKQV